MSNKWAFTAAACIVAAANPAQAATVAEWRTTIDQVVSDIRINHPNPFGKTGELTFARNVEELKEALPQLTDEQRMVRLMRIVASIGDGHTQLDPDDPAFALWYPVRFYEFSDGYYITAAHQSVRDLAGARVLAIAGRPVEEVAAAARDLRGADNMFDRQQRLDALHNGALMRGLGYADDAHRLRIRLRLTNGRVVDRVLSTAPTNDMFQPAGSSSFDWMGRTEVYGPPMAPFEEWVTAFSGLPTSAYRQIDLTRPPHFMYRRLEVARALPEHDAFYIQINAVAPEQAIPFLREQLAAIDTQRPRRVILDLRYNSGGDGSRMTEIVHQFVQREANPPWREFYLITGRKTFSAAVMMVNSFIGNVPLTVVGEPAGAALNSYGDAGEHTYTSPGIVLHVSTLRHQLSASDDLRSIIPVDVPALMSFADYAAGRDPAVDPILAGEEMRSIPAIASADGGAAARRVYRERQDRFSQLGWWTPPTEVQLRNVCDQLREAGRLQDALETCRLSAEIHPYIWNAWYNLAGAQQALNQEAERASSLKCVLALDPNNFNLSEIQPVIAAAGDVPLAAACPIERGGQ